VIAPAVGGDEVNAVNARFYARDRGINVIENRRKDAKNYKSMMQVRVDTETGSRTMAGTVFEGGQPRIVQVDAFDIDLKPSKHMLTMTYPDVPGMVGKFGTILGSHQINIARMEVGRSGRGEQAMILLSLDDAVPAAVVEEIRASVKVTDIRAITLA
jgi:D-3-phosphoglycerate dehydrogenase